MVFCLNLRVHRTRLLRQEVARHNGMHGAMTHGDGNNITHCMEGQSKACMLGMEKTCIYGKRSRRKTPLYSERRKWVELNHHGNNLLKAWECSSVEACMTRN